MSDAAPGDWPGRHESRREREQAERRYVAALAALDAAAELPTPVTSTAAASEADLPRLNRIWNKYSSGGARGPIGRVVAEFARLLPWRRRALHGALIAAVNRQAEITRALIDATRHFQSHVIWYGQTVAPFASTQAGTAGPGDPAEVNAALNAIAADWLRHRDAFQASEQRLLARMAALTRAYEELRDIANLTQHATVALQRQVGEMASATSGAAAPSAETAHARTPSTSSTTDSPSVSYVSFEDRFRGTREEIHQRLADYLPLFAGATDVVDIGCGRGELLELLREHHIPARGVDANIEMVHACRARGLEVEHADALTYLSARPDASLGGMTAIQVVEHLEPAHLVRFLQLAFQKLRPGAPLVLETVNVACWAAFFDSYLRDVTHARPLHPDTLRFLAQANGFANAAVQFRSPIPSHDRLPEVRLPHREDAPPDPVLVDLAAAINAHAERLNTQLFSHRDYAIVARR
jgi:2-polyprenyl-3-methyl-5-hydroxy-6-metoxy-1,4-benzoquinol methylase